MKINIPSYGNGLAHMKCIHCDYEVYQDSDYMDYYDDKDGWFMSMWTRWIKCYRRLR